ncbi:hypothetical protein GCM10009557_91610 [Virgisporangium ochraceum]|uniref:Uncharacterized protein n=2 Tax=Virgisporangium ochraceum TaxID=65505 RepID=A0A8J4E9T0_9ACTN|nr:hypothetical protein Voc01_025020 [Virgisporangium ochraceum]
MAVALVVVAVPVLTVLFNREIRALQQRVAQLERRPDPPAARPRPDAPAAQPETPAAQPRPELLDVLRTLSALRPAEPEFVEEYYVEADRD